MGYWDRTKLAGADCWHYVHVTWQKCLPADLWLDFIIVYCQSLIKGTLNTISRMNEPVQIVWNWMEHSHQRSFSYVHKQIDKLLLNLSDRNFGVECSGTH